MQKYRNIVICGDIGTGTSTLSKELAMKLGWERVSGGEFFRKWSKETGIPLWNKMAVPDEIDRKFDKQMLERMKKESRVIFDTHYGGWFAKDMKGVFKILLICNEQSATWRILNREASQRESGQDIEERRKQLRKKFEKLYSNEDYEDPKLFNIVINTSENSIKETLQKAYESFSSG